MIPTVSTIPIQQLASGDRLSIQVYKFVGATPGKKVYLQANLHGAEIAGNAVIHQLIEFLISADKTELTGEIWLVPVCNPLSTNQRSHNFSSGRYNIYDGKDWNRIFWDYEKVCEDLEAFALTQLDFDVAIAQQNYRQRIKVSFAKLLEKIQASSSVPFNDSFRYKLQSLSIDADYLIDIHSSSNQAIDYIYYFPNREESAKAFLLDYGILLDEYDGDAFDEAFIKPWLALEKIFSKLGKPTRFDIEAWTLELGSGMVMNPDSVAKGVRGVKNYLVQKGILATCDVIPTQTVSHATKFALRSQVKKYYAAVGGMIQLRVSLGTSVNAGERVYQVLSFNKEGLPTLIDVCAERSGIVFDLSTNHAVNEGEYVLSMLSVVPQIIGEKL